MAKRKGIKPPDKDVLLDIRILKKFTNKIQHCKEKNRRFNLTFQSFKNMFKAKKCYFTGMPIGGDNQSAFTVDRVDNSKGYEKGNVVACSREFNSLKGELEGTRNRLTFNGVLKGLIKLKKRHPELFEENE